jgi:hypothetical protein
VGPYLAASLLQSARDPRVWGWAALGAFLVWAGVSLDILAIASGRERAVLLGWGTLELVTTLACLAAATQIGGAGGDGDLEDPLTATRMGPLGLLGAQAASTVGRAILVGIPIILLSVVLSMNMAPAASARALSPSGSAVLWLVSLTGVSAWGLALGRALGVAGAAVLPSFAVGLFPPPVSSGVDTARCAVALLAAFGALAGAAALRPR